MVPHLELSSHWSRSASSERKRHALRMAMQNAITQIQQNITLRT